MPKHAKKTLKKFKELRSSIELSKREKHLTTSVEITEIQKNLSSAFTLAITKHKDNNLETLKPKIAFLHFVSQNIHDDNFFDGLFNSIEKGIKQQKKQIKKNKKLKQKRKTSRVTKEGPLVGNDATPGIIYNEFLNEENANVIDTVTIGERIQEHVDSEIMKNDPINVGQGYDYARLD